MPPPALFCESAPEYPGDSLWVSRTRVCPCPAPGWRGRSDRLGRGLLARWAMLVVAVVALPTLAPGQEAPRGKTRSAATAKPSAAPQPLRLPTGDVEYPPTLLLGVSDLTSGIGEAERDSYFGVLAHARRQSLDSQRQAATRNREAARLLFESDPRNRRKTHQLFYDLVTRPDTWRGHPVTLRGYIRDLTPMEAGENSDGLTKLYQAHLFTEDSAQFPYVIVCSQIPEGLPTPTARRPTDFITVTGYFYKLWTYRAGTETGHWSAPLILAQRLEWNPPPARQPLAAGWWWLLAGLLVALPLGWRELRRRDRAARRLLRDIERNSADEEAQSRALLKDLEQP